MKTRRGLVVLSTLLLVLAALIGCKSESIKADRQPAVLTLIEAGQGEKTALRFKPQSGVTENLVMTMTMKMKMLGQEVAIPPIDISMTATAKDVTADGFGYDYKITDVAMKGATGKMAEAANKMKQLAGISGSMKMNNRGIIQDSKIDIPSSVDADLTDTLENLNESMSRMMAPLPEEALGVGAKWDVKTSVDTGKGYKVDQIAHYELVSINGNKVDLKITIEQNANDQEFEVKGQKVKLVSLKSNGSGTSTLDLTKLTPVQSNVSVDANMKLNVKESTQEIGMTIGVQMQPR